jgi:hypothetical protein
MSLKDNNGNNFIFIYLKNLFCSGHEDNVFRVGHRRLQIQMQVYL